jgi:hypothetical protein
MGNKRSHISGSLAQVINRLTTATPKGQPLAEVLKIVQKETDSSNVRVSPDLRRATLEAGGLVSVRVTAARQPYRHGPWHLRFKSPSGPTQYRLFYFGGLNQHGAAVVHKVMPQEIGTKRTLTFPA